MVLFLWWKERLLRTVQLADDPLLVVERGAASCERSWHDPLLVMERGAAFERGSGCPRRLVHVRMRYTVTARIEKQRIRGLLHYNLIWICGLSATRDDGCLARDV